MHQNKGTTVAQCLHYRTNYVMDSDKTNDGELISAYACDPKTVDAEFLLSKREYDILTGRVNKGNVIAYQIRQSFRPGEVSPEEANRIGYELAERFLKGKHAFIVATHNDKSHIHNHLIFNSTTLDCQGKFRNFLGSGKAVARLSDTICLEHELSIVENPKKRNSSYNKWLGDKAKPSHRDLLRAAIDEALTKRPIDFDVFLSLMMQAGYTVSQGKHIAFGAQGYQRTMRLRSLGEGYSEEDIRAVLSGEKVYAPKKNHIVLAPKNQLLIDIDAKIQHGKGMGYQRWAKVFNLKQMAQTVNYLRENNLFDYDELEAKTTDATTRFHALSVQIKTAEKRMAEINSLKTHIISYMKTRDVYAEYRKAGYSKKYLAEHEGDIILHKAAKKAFDDLGIKKLPTVKSLQEEYAALAAEKKTAYPQYRSARDEMKELLVHKAKIDEILGAKYGESEKGKDVETSVQVI
jgi:Relaxase/Mobilisation nuclease domain.